MTFKSAAAAVGLMIFANAGSAAVVMTAQEVGADVVFSMTGSFDVSGLTLTSTDISEPGIDPSGRIISFGTAVGAPSDYYGLPTRFPQFGGGRYVRPDSSTGSQFTIEDRSVVVPAGVTSDTVDGTLTFLGTDFAGLGLTTGVYSWGWPGDTVTLTIGAAAATPVPVPASLPLLLAGMGILAWRRRAG